MSVDEIFNLQKPATQRRFPQFHPNRPKDTSILLCRYSTTANAKDGQYTGVAAHIA